MSSEQPSWKRFSRLRFSKKSLNTQVQKLEKGTVRHAHRFVTTRLDRLSGVKRQISGWILLVTLLVVVSATQWWVFRGAYTETTYANGGTYSEGVLGPLETLNPLFARSSAEKSAARLLFASLYHYDATGHLKGDLAESIATNEAETEYTVTLKKGLQWSNGTELNAEDVLFTINLLKNPDARTEFSGWQSINVTLVDAHTIKFVLSSPYAPFAHSLTFPILPKHMLNEVPASSLREHTYSRSPSVTSGPFALRLLQDGTSDGTKKIVHMVANPHYHGGVAKLERFQLYVYPNKDEIAKGLRTNEIIATPELTYAAQPDQLKRMYTSSSYGINNGVYALFNSQSPILSSHAVRQALAYSINTAELRSKLAQSNQSLDGPILASLIDGQLPAAASHDIEKAKSLLDQDGWVVTGNTRTKEGQKLTLSIVTRKGTEYEQVTNLLAKTWKDTLKIDTEVRIVDQTDTAQNVFSSVLQPRNFDVLVYELELGGDPDVYTYWHSSHATTRGLNFANYSNVIADDALESARGRATAKQRADRYKIFVQRWHADTPALALYQPKIDYIQLKSARTIDPDTTLVYPTDRYANVIYWAIQRQQVYKTP